MKSYFKKHALTACGMLAVIIAAYAVFAPGLFVWNEAENQLSPENRELLASLNAQFDVFEVSSLSQNRVLGQARRAPFLASVLQGGSDAVAIEQPSTEVLLQDREGEVLLVKSALSGQEEQMIAAYKNLPIITAAEPNQIGELAESSDDLFESALIDTDPAEEGNLSSETVQTPEKKRVKIAVIDSGIDIKHAAFTHNLWKNTAEQNGRPRVDDDKNGFVDDVHGWDFVSNDAILTDTVGHGTHISGIIGAEPTNFASMTGVNPDAAEIMVLRVADAKSGLKLSNVIAALNYAKEQGADVVNMSLGFPQSSEIFHDVVKAAYANGIFLVAAAGNNNSSAAQYPAAYPEVFSVGAVNLDGSKTASSNYGETVDTKVPGELFSTLPNQSYGTKRGTSQAAALVSGLASMRKSHFPNESNAEVEQFLQKYSQDFERAYLLSSVHVSPEEMAWISTAVRTLAAGKKLSASDVQNLNFSKNINADEVMAFLSEYFSGNDTVTKMLSAIKGQQKESISVAPNVLANPEYLGLLNAEDTAKNSGTVIPKEYVKKAYVVSLFANVYRAANPGKMANLSALWASGGYDQYLTRQEFITLFDQVF